MLTVKKLSMVIAGTALFAFSLGLEPAHAHLGHSHSPLEASEEGSEETLVVKPDTPRPTYYLSGGVFKFLTLTGETAGQFSLYEVTAPTGLVVPPHIHNFETESVYILEGEPTFQLENQTVVATPGSFAYLPKNRPHAAANTGTTARWLVFTTPAGFFEKFVAEAGVPVTDPSAPIPPLQDPAALVAVASNYGINFGLPSQPGAKDYLVVSPDAERPSFNAAGGLYTSLATSEETGGQFSLFDVSLPPQAGPSTQRHK